MGKASIAPGAAELSCLSRKRELDEIGFSPETAEELYTSICYGLQGLRERTRFVSYVNPHVFNLAKSNEKVRRFLGTADVVTVDGLGFALAVRWLLGHGQTRTVMTPLFDRVLATDDLPTLRAVLIGGTAPVVQQGAAAMNRASRRIQVVSTCHGYAAMEEHLAFLREHPDADLVLVAMGTPRSEELMLAARDLFGGKLFWNIGGGTLHFYAGIQKRVPAWVSRIGLQWLWRIAHEPAIAPRYFVGIPRFLAFLIRACFRNHQTIPEAYGRAYR